METDDLVLARSRGRPSCVAQGVFTPDTLKHAYADLKSIRATAKAFGVSPTTVVKYLSGHGRPAGRPAQPLPWKARCRSSIHDWFVEHRNDPPARSMTELVKLSGFTAGALSRYLHSRQKAAFEYLRTLPDPRTKVIIFRAIDATNVPSNLIKSYVLELDRFTLAVTLYCVLTAGGQRTIKLTFRDYETALTNTNPQLPSIGLVRPLSKPAWPL